MLQRIKPPTGALLFALLFIGTTDGQQSAPQNDRPQTPPLGRIAGQEFRPDKIVLDGTELTFTEGEGMFPRFKLTLFLPDKPLEKPVTVTPNERNPAIRQVQITYPVEGNRFGKQKTITRGYQARLELSEAASGLLRGKLDLQSDAVPALALSGTFESRYDTPWTETPHAGEKPWVISVIRPTDIGETYFAAGYFGITDEGRRVSNIAGAALKQGVQSGAITRTYEPRLSSIYWNLQQGFAGRHTRLEPGRYIFYVTASDAFDSQDRFAVWEEVRVQQDSQLGVTLVVDRDQSGDLLVVAPDRPAGQQVALTPLTANGELPLGVQDRSELSFASIYPKGKLVQSRTMFNGLRPGRYRVHIGDRFQDVEIKQGVQSKVTITD